VYGNSVAVSVSKHILCGRLGVVGFPSILLRVPSSEFGSNVDSAVVRQVSSNRNVLQ
jgi:hypothetical protein